MGGAALDTHLGDGPRLEEVERLLFPFPVGSAVCVEGLSSVVEAEVEGAVGDDSLKTEKKLVIPLDSSPPLP